MSLSDRLAAAEHDAVNAAARAAMCPAGRLVASMDETERAALDRLIQTVTYTGLSRILRDEGYKHDRSTLILHLKGECICVPEQQSG